MPGSGKNTVPGSESHPQQIGDDRHQLNAPDSRVVIPRSTRETLYAGAILLNCAVIPEYIRAALEHARYGIIEDAKPYYGEVPGLPRVFAAGRTLEECRRNLAGVIGERFIIRLRAAPWIGCRSI